MLALSHSKPPVNHAPLSNPNASYSHLENRRCHHSRHGIQSYFNPISIPCFPTSFTVIYLWKVLDRGFLMFHSHFSNLLLYTMILIKVQVFSGESFISCIPCCDLNIFMIIPLFFPKYKRHWPFYYDEVYIYFPCIITSFDIYFVWY